MNRLIFRIIGLHSLIIMITLTIVLNACNLPNGSDVNRTEKTSIAATVESMVTQTIQAQNQVANNQTIVAETVMAQLTQLTQSATEIPATAMPTMTSEPLNTTNAANQNTINTPIPPPCNWAGFVSDITYPDNSPVLVGQPFIKTWRFVNKGTCTWTNQYQLVFSHGNQMNAPASVNMTSANIPPGGYADVSVSLQAPSTAGVYQAFFRFRAPDGSLFGIGSQANSPFWVMVQAVNSASAPTDEPAASNKPDLKVHSFAANPATFVSGGSTNISVSVKNNGGAEAGAFNVNWFSGEAVLSPKCSWNITGLGAGETSVPLSCNYTFANAGEYNSYIVVDANNVVLESNESNNQQTLKVKVLMKILNTPIVLTPLLPLIPIITLAP